MRQKGISMLIGRTAVIAVAAALAFCLSGCRYTDVLTDLYYGQGPVNPTSSFLMVDTPESEVENLQDRDVIKRQDSRDETEVQKDKSDFSENGTSDQAASQKEHDPDSRGTGAATDGSEPGSNADGAGSASAAGGEEGEGSGAIGEAGGAAGEKEPSGAEDPDSGSHDIASSEDYADGRGDAGTTIGVGGSSDDQFTGNGDGSGGRGPGNKYSATGSFVVLPRDIHKVAACGPYATIVQMLAGAGALAGANQQWLANMQDGGYFPGELSATRALVAGEGTLLSDADVTNIINSGAEAFLCSATYGAMSSSQKDRLIESGVNVIEMPELGLSDTLDAEIVQAVRVVGELLKDSAGTSQYDAKAMADEYVAQHSYALSSVLRANGGNYASYQRLGYADSGEFQGKDSTHTAINVAPARYVTSVVSAWENTTQTRISVSSGRSTLQNGVFYPWGADAFYHTHQNYPLASWTVRAGYQLDVSDGYGMTLGATNKVAGNAYALVDYYLQHGGVMDWGNRGFSSELSATASDAFGLVSQHQLSDASLYSSPYQSGGMSEAGGSAAFAQPGWATVSWSDGCTYDGSIAAGQDRYPSVLARTGELAEKMKASADKVNGYYNIGYPYQIWVVPSGADGTWLTGTAESFLMVPWAYCMWNEGTDLGSCNSYVNNFYQTFYRCDGTSCVQDYRSIYQATCPRDPYIDSKMDIWSSGMLPE